MTDKTEPPPRARVARADKDTAARVEAEPMPDALTRKPVKEKSPAEWAYERLILYIRNFESRLDSSQEVAMGFTGGQAGILQIEGVGFFDPDLVTFYGRDEDGMRTQLIQHVSQLNVILRAVPKLAPEEPPRRIGFRLMAGWAGGEAGDASV
jgi:hypothetical protein